MPSHNLTRRDVLAAFVGLPLATHACRKAKRVPDGEFAFQPELLGHRIRDGQLPTIPTEKWERTGIVIVGAGVAGLSAARFLLAEGYEDFVVLELESAAGGTARSGSNATSAYPWGAHYITAPMKDNRALLDFLKEADVVESVDAAGDPTFREEFLCREPQERLFANGEWHDGLYLHEGETDDDKAQWQRFRSLMEGFAEARDRHGRRAFSVPLSLGSNDTEFTELDGISMDTWLTRQRLSSPRLRWLVDYACRDDFGAHLEQTSAWAGIHYYASRLSARGREPQPVLTWPSGNGWLISKLRNQLGTKLRTGLAAADIHATRDASSGNESLAIVALGAPPLAAGFHAKRVIFAAPQFVARAVVRSYRDAAPPHLGAFEYGAWMVANITLSGRPEAQRRRRNTMAWDNVLRDSASLGYVCATHQTGADHGPTVLTYYLPLCDENPRDARKRLYAAGRDEWADVALTDLEVAHPDIRALASRVDVVRWGHAMVRPTPGFMWGGKRTAAIRPFQGIHFAHTDLSGVSLFEEAFDHGIRAAKEALVAVRG